MSWSLWHGDMWFDIYIQKTAFNLESEFNPSEVSRELCLDQNVSFNICFLHLVVSMSCSSRSQTYHEVQFYLRGLIKSEWKMWSKLSHPAEVGDGWMDGWMDGWRDGWMEGWMDGWGFFWTYYIMETVLFTLILFVWSVAQHPEISADILVRDKTMTALM